MSFKQCMKFIWLPIFILFVGLYIVLWMQSTSELTWFVWMRIEYSYQIVGIGGLVLMAGALMRVGISQKEPSDAIADFVVIAGLISTSVGMLGIITEGSIAAPWVITPVIRSADDTADDSDNLLNSKYVTKSTVTVPSI